MNEKEIMNLEEASSFEQLYKKMMKCKSGVMWKDSTAHFYLNGLIEIYKLEQALNNGTYEERAGKVFIVYEPKKRDL